MTKCSESGAGVKRERWTWPYPPYRELLADVSRRFVHGRLPPPAETPDLSPAEGGVRRNAATYAAVTCPNAARDPAARGLEQQDGISGARYAAPISIGPPP